MDLLKTENRDLGLSKGQLMKHRKKGLVPSVIYDGKTDSIPVFVNRIAFEKIYSVHGKVFELQTGSKKMMVNTKEIQKDPLGTILLHVSFQELTKGQKTTVNVPVKIVGDSVGVKDGGTISIVSETLALNVLPTKVPASIEVDVTELKMGDHLSAKDIKLPEGAEYNQSVDLETNVVFCNHPQKIVAEATAEVAETEVADAPADAAPAEESKE